jgi:hypothetical protein
MFNAMPRQRPSYAAALFLLATLALASLAYRIIQLMHNRLIEIAQPRFKAMSSEVHFLQKTMSFMPLM